MKTRLTILMLFAGIFCADAQPWNWQGSHLSYAREGLSATTLDDSVFFSGGRLYNFSYVNTVDIYDVGDNAWYSKDLESTPRWQTVSVSCNGKVFIAGGNNGPANYNFKEVDIFDKETGTWTIDSLSVARSLIGACCYMNKVYFAGGVFWGYNVEVYDVIEVYDTETETWDTPLYLTEPKAAIAVTAAGGKVFFAGGAPELDVGTDLVEVYDVNTGDWSYDTLSQARSFPAAVAYGNKVYFAGGALPNNSSSDVVDIYNVDTETWEETQTLSEPRIVRALKVKDALLFIGETDFISANGIYGPANGVIDVYYPETGLWNTPEVSDLNLPRITYGCAAYENKAFVGGGWPGGGSLTDDVSILEYDTLWVGLSEPPFQRKGFSVSPNPFTTNIQIDYTLAQATEASISIYNNMGTLVETLLDTNKPAGNHKVFFDGSNLPVGIYFSVLKTNKGSQTKKIIKH